MTSSTFVGAATLFGLAGSGLMAGVFFIFSVCIMKVLGAQPAAQGIATMQSISIVIINPWFMAVFLGTVALSVYVLIAALANFDGAASLLLIGGSCAYLIGAFLVTMLFNVPRNDALAALQPDTAEAARVWAEYLSTWTLWNHVRGIAATAAMGLFAAALWVKI